MSSPVNTDKKVDYVAIYDAEYYSGKKSFFYKLTGYKDFQGYFDRLARWMGPYIQGQQILDVGCAYGFMIRRFEQPGRQMYGTDVSEHALTQCKQALPNTELAKVVLGRERLPWADGHFDSLYSNDVVEHIEYSEQGAAFDELARVLKKGGHFSFTTPNYGILRKAFYRVPDRMEHHVGLRHVSDWVSFASNHGFEPVEAWTYLHGLLPFRTTAQFLPETLVVLRRK